jgi:putative ABC transport system substrate-binding protein
MRRRAILAAVLVSLPSVGRAQRTASHRIGFLLPSHAEAFVRDMRERLRRLGYVEGRGVGFEVRSAEGHLDRLPALAAELVRLPVDVIVANQTPAAHAAKAATGSIPIVMTAGDPVRTGLVESLARPGGNITGMSGSAADLGAKLLSLVREAFPSTDRVGVLANATDPFTAPFLELLEGAQRGTGVSLYVERVPPEDPYRDAFAAFERHRVQAVIVQPSLRRERAIALANAQRLPTASPIEPFAAEGGVLAYASSGVEVRRTLAEYVDRILRGAKPADLPVQQPTEYTLFVNVKAARALGFEIPLSILVRADELIE